MLKSFYIILKVRLYLLVFQVLNHIGSVSLQNEAGLVTRKSNFYLYTIVLELYSLTIKAFEQEGSELMTKFQEKRLGSLLQLANQADGWSKHFKSNAVTLSHGSNFKNLQTIPPVDRGILLKNDSTGYIPRSACNKPIAWRRSGGTSTGISFAWGHDLPSLYVCVPSHFIIEMEKNDIVFDHLKNRNFYIQFNYSHRAVASPFRWFLSGDYTLRNNEADFDAHIRSMVKEINATGSCVMRTSPTELNFLLGELEIRDLHPSIAACLVVGQFLEDDIRERAQQYLKCPVIVHYGAQEIGPLAMECPDNRGFYHIFSERMVVEVVDENNSPVPLGSEGAILLTPLDNTTMPLIRYKIGDIGILHKQINCSCKSRSQVVQLCNRSSDFLTTASGEKISIHGVMSILNKKPYIYLLRRYRVHQTSREEVSIILEPRKPIPLSVMEELESTIKSILSCPELTIKITQVDIIPQDTPKFRVFIPIT